MKYNWKWSYGEKQEQSKRDTDKEALMRLNNENAESMKNAHSMSLNHDENTWDMMTMLNNKEERKNNREELNFKVSDRQMMQQIGNNPFLENNYQNDISNHNVFLIPKNSK
jgi:hypothetical protein